MPAPIVAPGLCSRPRARPPTLGRIRSTAVATYVQRRAGSLSAGSSETQATAVSGRVSHQDDEDALAASRRSADEREPAAVEPVEGLQQPRAPDELRARAEE